MRTWIAFGSALAAAAVVVASPGAAQERDRSTAREIAREIRKTAEDIRTVRDAVDESVSEVRFRGRDRWAIDRCEPYVERYGRMNVDDVRRYKRYSLRVYGTVGDDRYGARYDRRYDDRYDRRYDRRGGDRYERRYGRDRYALRSFTCTVREDGRVKLKTKRLRR